jgi:hypothetical protein
MIAGITVRKTQPSQDKIDNTKLQIASGSVRAVEEADEGCGGKACGGVSSAIAPF